MSGSCALLGYHRYETQKKRQATRYENKQQFNRSFSLTPVGYQRVLINKDKYGSTHVLFPRQGRAQPRNGPCPVLNQPTFGSTVPINCPSSEPKSYSTSQALSSTGQRGRASQRYKHKRSRPIKHRTCQASLTIYILAMEQIEAA